MIIHGAHKIYLDEKLFQEFGDSIFLNNRSFYGSPSISCRELKSSNKLTWVVYSYTNYFSRFSYFPKITEVKPKKNLINETLNVITAGVLIVLTFFTFILSAGKLPFRLILLFCGSNLAFSFYFFLTTSSFFLLEIPMKACHKLADIGALTGMCLFVNMLTFLQIVTKQLNYIFGSTILVSILIIVLGNNGDQIQFGTSISFPVILFVLTKSFISQIRKEKNLRSTDDILRMIGLGIWIVSILNDIVVVSGILDGYLIMNIGTVGSYILFSVVLNNKILNTYKERDYLRANLEKEVEIKTEKLANTMQELKDTQSKLFKITSQVAHDIRSPLAALKVISLDLAELNEDKRSMIKTVIDRVSDIANTLAYRNFEKNLAHEQEIEHPQSNILMASLIDKVMTEKRIQYRSNIAVKIQNIQNPDSYGIFIHGSEVELSRILSNLINNAVEALTGHGEILLNISSIENKAIITLSDNGKGIPPSILSKLGTRGITHGKTEGSGLGLFHAKNYIESIGGSIRIDSKLENGTCVTLCIPQAPAPTWFVKEIRIKELSYIVILDDDINIHQVWAQRFSILASSNSIKIIHFSTPEHLKVWVNKNQITSKVLYLLDYEFIGSNYNGIQLARELDIYKNTILVTSRYEEAPVLKDCEHFQISLLPKGMAGLIPIKL